MSEILDLAESSDGEEGETQVHENGPIAAEDKIEQLSLYRKIGIKIFEVIYFLSGSRKKFNSKATKSALSAENLHTALFVEL